MNPTGNTPPSIIHKKSKKTIFLKFVLPVILLLVSVALLFMYAGVINYQIKTSTCGHEPIIASKGSFGGADEYYRPQDIFYKSNKYESSEPIPQFTMFGGATLYCNEEEAIDASYSNDYSPVYRQHVETRLKERNKDF